MEELGSLAELRRVAAASEAAALALREQGPAAPEGRRRFLEATARRSWEQHYKRTSCRGFGDRHYLFEAFAEELRDPPREALFLDLGCGVGNTLLPIFEALPRIRCLGVDLSERAVHALRGRPGFDARRCAAHACDLTAEGALPALLAGRRAQIATCFFTLSAIPPAALPALAAAIADSLAPGGALLLRDYARHDLAQLRFRAGCKLAEDYYARADGTLAHYLTPARLRELFAALRCKRCEFVAQHKENRATGSRWSRLFVEAVFTKPPAAAGPPRHGTAGR